MANRFKHKEEEPQAVEPQVQPEEPTAEQTDATQTAEQHDGKETNDKKKNTGRLKNILGGEFLGDKLVTRQIWLVLLILFYMLLIVGNRYRVESYSQEKIATEERINYLRQRRIMMQKKYQQSVKISQIASDLESIGIGLTAGPPYEVKEER